jgi:hypothetical protein
VYLDNLKVLLVVGVIAVHTAIIYGVDGAFYLEDYDSMSDVSVGVLTAFVAVGFLFGLGAFFLIAGRLSGPSLDRKAPVHARPVDPVGHPGRLLHPAARTGDGVRQGSGRGCR